MSRRFALLASFAIAGLAFALYANALGGSFQFDDATSILENESLRSPDPRAWWAFWPGRMVAYTTLGIDWHLHGTAPRGYHVTNVAIHALAGLAVLWMLTQLLALAGRGRAEARTGAAVAREGTAEARVGAVAAWVGAAVFVAHPLQTQAVAYITQRMASLYTLFYVTAVAAHLHGLARQRRGQPAGWTRAVGLGSGLLAVLTKEPALTLPLAILLVDFAAAPQSGGRRRRVLPYAPLLLVPLLAAWLGGGHFGADEATLTAQTARVSRATYLLTECNVLARYLRLLVVPLGQNLDPDVPWRTSALEPAVWLPVALHAVLLAAALWSWRRGARLVAVAIAWWYLTLLPESSVFPIADAMAEHRLYAAMPGFALGVALGWDALRRRWRRSAIVAAVAVLATLSALTVQRNRVWHDPYALWRDVAAKSPAKGRPHAALGWLHHKAGREEMAVEKLEQAVALDATDPQAWNNLGLACQALGRHERAAQAFQAAVELRPREATLWLNLSVALERLGRLPEAARALEECLRRDPQNDAARARLEALRQGR